MRIGIVIICCFLMTACANSNWRNASREPAGIAAAPSDYTPALVEVYAADAFSWRGWFAVHTWIAIKPQNASAYTVYEVVGWRTNRNLPALYSYTTTTPDRYWYGAKPERLLQVSGEQASALIPKLENAIEQYPWPNEYRVFPGPNSNTFPAWVAKTVPELGLELPFSAIGSGYADRDE